MDWNKLWHIVKNKYVAASLIFAVLIIFLDQNNLFVISRLRREVRHLRTEEKSARRAIVADSIHAVNLVTNLDTIERFAREEYLMKRPDEDVYIFND
ncbi:MAG: Septum formation initiator [bacterium P3]|nr:MAG: Septum formation initiator [bacterium P3]KWW42762.1 MAG: Septum formation initiator [bacterium F083]